MAAVGETVPEKRPLVSDLRKIAYDAFRLRDLARINEKKLCLESDTRRNELHNWNSFVVFGTLGGGCLSGICLALSFKSPAADHSPVPLKATPVSCY